MVGYNEKEKKYFAKFHFLKTFHMRNTNSYINCFLNLFILTFFLLSYVNLIFFSIPIFL